MRPPDSLYKYQRFSPSALANLVGRQIWFSRPSAFNDPYDCALRPAAELSHDDLERLFAFVQEKSGNPELIAKQYRKRDGSIDESFREQVLSGVGKVFDLPREEVTNRRGVACLTAKVDDLLMWSHYADGHRGFCLEFSTAYAPFDRARAVEYSDLIPIVNPATLLLERSDDWMRLLSTKMSCWSYEEEWRLFHKEPDLAFGYGVEALTGVYFGTNMSRDHIEIIALILRGAPTQLYQMRRSDTEFKVMPAAVNHTPYDYSKDRHGASARASNQPLQPDRASRGG